MAQDNIYDVIISELILRIAELSSTQNTVYLQVTNSIGANSVPVGFSDNVSFTSTVVNMPTGYAVQGTTHEMTYPGGATENSSLSSFTGTPQAVSIAILAGTYTVNSTVTLEDISGGGGPDITITGSNVITAVDPAYYGVKPYSATPVVSGLNSMAYTSTMFELTSTGIGRLVLALPTGATTPVSIYGPNGLVYSIANDFTMITNGSFDFYQLNYDTQLTGTNIKTFTISYT